MTRYQLDSHKLIYHPQQVADFLEGHAVWTLYTEISPTSFCNHRCLFCNFNYMCHKAQRLPQRRMVSLVAEFAKAGVKALAFVGSGEPTLHIDTFPAICKAG
jgi:MoaA/NifB/PqqE/SkfB family radical SAM enzyme